MDSLAQDSPDPARRDGVGVPTDVPPQLCGEFELRCLCLDLLGRPPLKKERQAWVGVAFDVVVRDVLGSAESWRHWYEEQLYYFLLIDNFRPAGESYDSIPERLHAGAIDVREAIHSIALSPSFDARNPGADTFVTVVMEQLDGLEVQKCKNDLEIGKRVYDGASGLFLGASASSQSDVVKVAVQHKLFASTFLAREHARIVHREADKADLSRWATQFQRDPRRWSALLHVWLRSKDYLERTRSRVPLTNRAFIQALFVDVRDAVPDPENARRMRTALDGLSDPLPLRSVLARMVVDASPASARAPERLGDDRIGSWIRERFLRFLGREPSEAEAQSFARALRDPAGRTEFVDYALLSHPEYHGL